MSATIPTLSYEEAKAIYTRLCAKARREFSRDTDAAHTLCTGVQVMSCAYDWGQDRFPSSELKHLAEQDRTDFLLLIAYLCTTDYFPGVFAEINHKAFSTL